MVIVEGADGSGKTTLCDRIVERFGGEVLPKMWPEAREDMPNVGVKRRVYESLAIAVRGSARDPVFVHDRLFWSELVYGRVLRGRHAFTRPVEPKKGESPYARPRSKDERTYEHDLILATILALKCPVIFCLPPPDVVIANVERTVQLEGVREQIAPIYDRYRVKRAQLRGRAQVLTYDYTGQWPGSTLDKIFDTIEKYLIIRDERKWGT